MTTSKRYWIRNVDKAWRIQKQRIISEMPDVKDFMIRLLVEKRKGGIFVGGKHFNNPPRNCKAWFTVTHHNGTVWPSGITFVINR